MASRNQLVVFCVGDNDGVEALHFIERFLHGFGEPCLAGRQDHGLGIFLYKVHGNLRIRFRYKSVPLFEKLLFHLFIIFKYAVMDDGDLPGTIQMRVGVDVGHAAVGSPARMAKREGAFGHIRHARTPDFPRLFLDRDFFTRLGNSRHAPRIIATVFEKF